jgi:oligopeptide transport system substrate-binding protein
METTRGLDYDIARMGWIGDYTDPNTFLDMWVTNGGQNQTGWSSPLYDRLIRAAGDVGSLSGPGDPLIALLAHPEDVRAALDQATASSEPAVRLSALAKARMLLLREAERILVHDEVPLMPLYFYVNSGLVNPRVRGFYETLKFQDGTTSPNLIDDHPLRDLYFDESGGSHQ